MLIDIRDILKLSGLEKTVELEIEAGGCGITDFEKECKFNEPIFVKAELSNIKGIIRAKGDVKTGYDTVCDRCLKPVHMPVHKGFDYEYVQAGSLGEVPAEDAEVFEYTGKEIDIGHAVRDTVLLEIPIRHLCSEGCLSLCPMCGKDLNEGGCGCREPEGDIRFAALKALIDDNE